MSRLRKRANNLYLVARWGNDSEGPDGKDTLFLVAAGSHLGAARAAEKELGRLPHDKVRPQANWICLLGIAWVCARYEGVLKGPYYDLSGVEGSSVIWTREPWQRKWYRKTLGGSDVSA